MKKNIITLNIMGYIFCAYAMASTQEMEGFFSKCRGEASHMGEVAQSPRLKPRCVATLSLNVMEDSHAQSTTQTQHSSMDDVVLKDFYRVCALDLAGLESFVSPLEVEERFMYFQEEQRQANSREEAARMHAYLSQVIQQQGACMNRLFLRTSELEEVVERLYRENAILLMMLRQLEMHTDTDTSSDTDSGTDTDTLSDTDTEDLPRGRQMSRTSYMKAQVQTVSPNIQGVPETSCERVTMAQSCQEEKQHLIPMCEIIYPFERDKDLFSNAGVLENDICEIKECHVAQRLHPQSSEKRKKPSVPHLNLSFLNKNQNSRKDIKFNASNRSSDRSSASRSPS